MGMDTLLSAENDCRHMMYGYYFGNSFYVIWKCLYNGTLIHKMTTFIYIDTLIHELTFVVLWHTNPQFENFNLIKMTC
jgi:hypothetical protein